MIARYWAGSMLMMCSILVDPMLGMDVNQNPPSPSSFHMNNFPHFSCLKPFPYQDIYCQQKIEEWRKKNVDIYKIKLKNEADIFNQKKSFSFYLMNKILHCVSPLMGYLGRNVDKSLSTHEISSSFSPDENRKMIKEFIDKLDPQSAEQVKIFSDQIKNFDDEQMKIVAFLFLTFSSKHGKDAAEMLVKVIKNAGKLSWLTLVV